MTLISTPIPPSGRGDPPWVVATLFPNQGEWTEAEYLDLNRRTNRLVELSDGSVEVLDLPTKSHQLIGLNFYSSLKAFLSPPAGGNVVVAPYPVKLWEGKFREPDVLFVRAEHAHWLGEDFATGADGVVEILSQDRGRDLATKRTEYAKAGIEEYWIIDPRERRVTLLRLDHGAYVTVGEFGEGTEAPSLCLPGFRLNVSDLFRVP